MGKMIVIFFVFTIMFALVIATFRELTKREVWRLTKYVGYSIMCSILTILLLFAIVMLF